MEKLLESALLWEAGSLNELLFEGVVWVVGNAKDDVANFSGVFGSRPSHHICSDSK